MTKNIAIVLTACGIETLLEVNSYAYSRISIAIVLTACGIETVAEYCINWMQQDIAIVLTACGIETSGLLDIPLLLQFHCNSAYRLRY